MKSLSNWQDRILSKDIQTTDTKEETVRGRLRVLFYYAELDISMLSWQLSERESRDFYLDSRSFGMTERNSLGGKKDSSFNVPHRKWLGKMEDEEDLMYSTLGKKQRRKSPEDTCGQLL